MKLTVLLLQNSKIFKTSDGGDNWQIVYRGFSFSSFILGNIILG